MIRALVLVAIGLFVFQVGPSRAVRGKLFQQVLADDPDLRECLKGQEGGAASVQENMSVEQRDLNGDGVKEYEIQLPGICGCGAQNCTIYLYRANGQGYEALLKDASGMELHLLKTASNGYADLQIDAHDSAATQARTVYKFDGRQYREAGTTMVHLGTGESKPASRRVQFQRGSSAAVLRGKVSLSLPDTYLVGARAGQTMSVQLSSPQKAVKFTVMSPESTTLIADDTRIWAGKLPETGDYYIIVRGDERGGTYAMTVTIK